MVKRKIKLDKDTDTILNEADALRQMIETEGWKIAKARLIKRVTQNSIIEGLNLDDPNLVIQLKVRDQVATELVTWLRDIEGTVEQGRNNNQMFYNETEEYITKLI